MDCLGFIGTGNIAKAIISNICSCSENLKIFGYDKSKNNYDFLKNFNIKICNNIEEVVKNCKYLILAIKPQNYSEVLESIKNFVLKETVLISVAAGIGESFVCSYFGFCPKFIQVMPNTPIILGFGAIAMARGSLIKDNEFEFAYNIFSKGGVVCEVEESKMNYITPINGSSPAFIYLFCKAVLKYAKKKGIDNNTALVLFCNSLIGSAKMMLDSKKTIDELILDVSSKKGTTIEGLGSLKENNFEEIIEKACEKTANRAFELSEDFK